MPLEIGASMGNIALNLYRGNTIMAQCIGRQAARFHLKEVGQFQAKSVKEFPCGQSTSRNLKRRIADYKTIDQKNIQAFTMPGSLKK